MSRVVLQFLAEQMNMHNYCMRVDTGFAAPYLLEELVSCQDHTTVAEQIDEQIEEERAAKFNFLITLGHVAPANINAEVPGDQNLPGSHSGYPPPR